MLRGGFLGRHFPGGFDNVLRSSGLPVDFERVASAEEGDFAILELQVTIVRDGEILRVLACAMGRVVAYHMQQVV